jgi:hypothetical protein
MPPWPVIWTVDVLDGCRVPPLRVSRIRAGVNEPSAPGTVGVVAARGNPAPTTGAPPVSDPEVPPSMVLPQVDTLMVGCRMTYPRAVCGAELDADRQKAPKAGNAEFRSALVRICGTPKYTPGT